MFSRFQSYLSDLRSGSPGRWAVLLCFVAFFVIGLLSVRDYGVPYDEGIMDSLGRDSYNYIFEGGPWPENDDWRYHGPLVEFGAYSLQKMFVPFENEYTYQRILIRRLICFAFFYTGLLLLYRLAKRHFGDWKWALLCVALFFLTPRIFAHGFYNSRDIPQLTLFLGSMLTMLRLLDRRTWQSAVLHGAVAALALSVRMTALLVPAFTALFLLIDIAAHRPGWMQRLRQNALLYATFTAALAIVTYVCWPFLWPNPVVRFIEAYVHMSSLGSTSVEFFGTIYGGLPLHYIPVWIAITVPVVYSLFFLLGLCVLPVLILKTIRSWPPWTRDRVLFLLWFFVPILSIMMTGAGIYTEWRHVYFIYPAFLLIAVSGARWAWEKLGLRPGMVGRVGPVVVLGILGVQMAGTAVWMFRNHPFENIYFSSAIALSTVEKHLALDYWALSYKQSFEWLLEHEERNLIVFYSDETVAGLNAYNLFPEALQRVITTRNKDDAQYVLTRSPEVAGSLPLIHAFTVDGMRINGIYKGLGYSRNYTEENIVGPAGNR